MREDHKFNSPDSQREDHFAVASANLRDDHPVSIHNNQPDDNIITHKSQPDNPKMHSGAMSKRVSSGLIRKVLFVIVLIGFLLAVRMLVKNKIDSGSDNETTGWVTTHSLPSVSVKTPLLTESTTSASDLTDISREPEATTPASFDRIPDFDELSDIVDEIISHAKPSTPTMYTVTLDSNGGNSIFGSYQVESLTLPVAKRIYAVSYVLNGGQGDISSYEVEVDCLGWSKSKDSTNASYSCGSLYTPTSDETLYPVWPSTTVLVTSQIPTRSGYTFLGWSKNRNSTSPDYTAGDTIHLTKDFNCLYALWVKFGDINRDNETSIADLVILRAYLANERVFNSEESRIADLNSDGLLNEEDVEEFRRYLTMT